MEAEGCCWVCIRHSSEAQKGMLFFFPQHLRSRIFALETIWKESFVRVLGLG